ncbi:SDR family NAD(P)-dependent oxidoreductase [Rhodococcus sp. WAY2]|uniref:SDR family NAD(P)-dependent oxidoreductase n=1 Tax=Rhodococcus sp. WAY2 TaxID=2663121 RepID=UPI00132038BE|nr:SDR family NAD(P)-dependent oxidoreductase [Rhodococcus sp. WAY2]QHE72401.1 oxidoreductase, short-chain dehydrogenase-reductase family [Rhodococcus sp. WAY2]
MDDNENRMSVDGKVAVITGGARGVGAATAQLLVDKGARVAIIDLEESPVVFDRGSASMLSLKGDVTDANDMAAAVEKVLDHFGRIDIVIANAGVAARGSTVRASSTQVNDRLWNINVGGVLTTVQACLPSVIANRGHVVLLSSVFAFLNGAGTLPYAMSKAAVEQLGRGLRVELASQGVTVTTVYFSLVDTEMIRRSVDSDPTAQKLLGTLPRSFRKRITPAEAAAAIVGGVEHRKARVFRPRRWAGVSALRGVVGMALDAHQAADVTTQTMLRELDQRDGEGRLTS